MKVITNYEEYMKEVLRILDTQSGIVRVSSFNLYAPEDSLTKEFVDRLLSRDSCKIMIGTSYRLCQPNCPACIANNTKRSFNLEAYVKSHKIRVYDNLHLKYISCGSKAITGGMNLTGSGYHDLAIRVGETESVIRMNEHFDSIFESFGENKLYRVVEPVFPYGKYKGKTIQDVSKTDPSYIKWAKTNFPDSIKELLKLV